jgi:hypothetical protein
MQIKMDGSESQIYLLLANMGSWAAYLIFSNSTFFLCVIEIDINTILLRAEKV